MSKFVFFSIVILIALTVGQMEGLSIENQLQKIGTIKQTHINNLCKNFNVTQKGNGARFE
jgi:hypothetical protein